MSTDLCRKTACSSHDPLELKLLLSAFCKEGVFAIWMAHSEAWNASPLFSKCIAAKFLAKV